MFSWNDLLEDGLLRNCFLLGFASFSWSHTICPLSSQRDITNLFCLPMWLHVLCCAHIHAVFRKSFPQIKLEDSKLRAISKYNSNLASLWPEVSNHSEICFFFHMMYIALISIDMSWYLEHFWKIEPKCFKFLLMFQVFLFEAAEGWSALFPHLAERCCFLRGMKI